MTIIKKIKKNLNQSNPSSGFFGGFFYYIDNMKNNINNRYFIVISIFSQIEIYEQK